MSQCMCFFLLTEVKYKQIVTENMTDFTKFTNFEKLLPIMMKHSLVNESEADRISGLKVREERANFFFYQLLPSKGTMAYNTLARCISEEEEHLGHGSLLRLFQAVSVAEKPSTE